MRQFASVWPFTNLIVHLFYLTANILIIKVFLNILSMLIFLPGSFVAFSDLS